MNLSNQSVESFIQRWQQSGASERSNYQLFLTQLCEIIEVEIPQPAKPENERNAYVFERAVPFDNNDGTHSTRFIDLYKRGCFVLEAKQGSSPVSNTDAEPISSAGRERRGRRRRGQAVRGTVGWDIAMLAAKGQADQYIRALPQDEGRPPFLLVVDVGHSIEVYAEFSCTGGAYTPFPASGQHRIRLEDLRHSEIRERLRLIWGDPHRLDPARQSAKATRDIASQLAKLAISLEAAGHTANDVASFLMRCLFTMFAEDVRLLPADSFTLLLESLRQNPAHFVPMVEELWESMNHGGFSTSLRELVLKFNGGLFADSTALPLSEDQLELLLEAARCDWCDVEPAIFGTLLERALDPVDRHKLGAHYTPRTYVERLVTRTVIDPLRADWNATHAAAVSLEADGDAEAAIKTIKDFHRQLVSVRVLDPACGSGNFLYVTFAHLKLLEEEVFDALALLGEGQRPLGLPGETVYPDQLLGLEVNPRAASIAELVLWIGALQWHHRIHGDVQPIEPVIRNFHNIQCRDAVLRWSAEEPVLAEDGRPITRWDGRTMKMDESGRPIPDTAARVPVTRLIDPLPETWPDVDFVVGNPPFIGASRLREALGDGYTEALRQVNADLGESCDLVMYWWHHAAQLARQGRIRRFGFVTTNSISQTFNRRVVQPHLSAKDGISLIFAIPDHPWVDATDGAAVRIAMTVGEAGTSRPGTLRRVVAEEAVGEEGYEVTLSDSVGIVHADLTVGADVTSVKPLRANEGLSCPGVKLHGSGFIVTPEEAAKLGLGRVEGLEHHIRPYRNGRDLTQRPRGVMVIDLFGLEEVDVRRRFPEVYQHVLDQVKTERISNRRATYRKFWWIFGEPRRSFRPALKGLNRYIATVETSKHRFFQFLDARVLPDNMLIAIASDDPYLLGVLSSRHHICWALASGGRLGYGNDPRYNKTRCFEPYPFPDISNAHREMIATLAEDLNAFRNARLHEYPDLTMTKLYNVLEKERCGESLTATEQKIHGDGLVSVIRELHDELDAVVAAAYGWPQDLPDADTLHRLVALNRARRLEEANGLIRWLRPDFQAAAQGEISGRGELALGTATKSVSSTVSKFPWPTDLQDRFQALQQLIDSTSEPQTAEQIARRFQRAQTRKVIDLLKILETLGHVRVTTDGRYLAA